MYILGFNEIQPFSQNTEIFRNRKPVPRVSVLFGKYTFYKDEWIYINLVLQFVVVYLCNSSHLKF